MLRHIVAWKLNSSYSHEEKEAVKQELKARLEALIPLIPEIKELAVYTNLVERSTMDVMLDTLFESSETLSIYRDHPDHVAVGDYLVTISEDRTVLDYEV